MYKKPIPSRLSYIFTIAFSVILFSSTIIFFDQLDTMKSWTPEARSMMDKLEIILRHITGAILIVSIVGWIFREIRHSGAIENILVRRFLPIIRFFVTASIWIVTLFDVLEKLSIDTRSVLTGAGIGGAILVLAAKDVMTNFLGSISILLGRVFDIGESIRIRTARGVYEGIVEEITLNYTKITHTSGEVVYIPNRSIYTETLENLSRRRFETYTYIIPFAKGGNTSSDIQERLRIIEGKISEYDPLSISWETESPNAGDYTYRITVKFPEANESINREIRLYLTEHIFRG